MAATDPPRADATGVPHHASAASPAELTVAPSTAGADYAMRLRRMEGAWWKRLLDVQRPYRWNLRRLRLGRTLDVGCGIGRNLINLRRGSIGVDHNAEAVTLARARGLPAWTVAEFDGSELARRGAFDSVLVAHVVEHMSQTQARDVVRKYLEFLKPDGRVVFMTPQERGHASDPTHVRFCGFAEVGALAESLGLGVVAQYSFPLPRWAGRFFTYNEFNVLTRRNSPGETRAD